MADRREAAFEVESPEGRKRVTITNIVTVDDVVRLTIGARVSAVLSEADYVTPISPEIQDALVRSMVTQRG